MIWVTGTHNSQLPIAKNPTGNGIEPWRDSIGLRAHKKKKNAEDRDLWRWQMCFAAVNQIEESAKKKNNIKKNALALWM